MSLADSKQDDDKASQEQAFTNEQGQAFSAFLALSIIGLFVLIWGTGWKLWLGAVILLLGALMAFSLSKVFGRICLAVSLLLIAYHGVYRQLTPEAFERRERIATLEEEAQARGATLESWLRCKNTEDALFNALFMSRSFIQDRLKTPNSASFPSRVSDPGVSVAYGGECRFHVSAYVDAQNSFGAEIRTPYRMTLTYLPADEVYRATDLSF